MDFYFLRKRVERTDDREDILGGYGRENGMFNIFMNSCSFIYSVSALLLLPFSHMKQILSSLPVLRLDD